MVLKSSGQLSFREYPQAHQLFKQLFVKAMASQTFTERACQETLWQIWQAGAEDAAVAQLCLRCWLSHRIAIACKKLAQDFGETYGFRAAELCQIVLDDTGEMPPAHQSFAIKILARYRPERGALSAWASRLTQNNREVNDFLLSQGLYRATPWAILNDTKLDQLPRFLPHLSQSEVAIAGQLLRAYHRVYRRDRIMGGARRGQRCLPPTDEQLHRINPSQPTNETRLQLYELAEQLRQARVVRRGGPLPTQSLEGKEIDPAAPQSDDDDEQSNFMETYRQNFRSTLTEAIRSTVDSYTRSYQAKKVPKGEIYRQALELFHCQGCSMKDIASTLGLTNQVAVTRLLNLNQFRAEVCIYWVNQLKQRVKDSALEHMSVAQLDTISSQLDQILEEEIQDAKEAAKSEAQIPKDRTAKSLFARQLCATVPSMPLPPV